jgi:hypothetical protein
MDEYLYSGRNYSDGKFDFGEFISYGDVFENADGVVIGGNSRRVKGRKLKDEYSNLPGDLLTNPWAKPNPVYGKPIGTSIPPTKITPSQFTAIVKDIPGGPTAAEQIDKAKKEGKFWNSLKGSWDKFKVTENGQIVVSSAMSLLLSKLGGAGTTAPTTDLTPPAAEDPTKNQGGFFTWSTKTPGQKAFFVIGGLAIAGLITYAVIKKK